VDTGRWIKANVAGHTSGALYPLFSINPSFPSPLLFSLFSPFFSFRRLLEKENVLVFQNHEEDDLSQSLPGANSLFFFTFSPIFPFPSPSAEEIEYICDAAQTVLQTSTVGKSDLISTFFLSHPFLFFFS